MCKVSTLRNVEPPVPKFPCGTNQLPKIRNGQDIKMPLTQINEDSVARFSLPSLIESHLPTPLPASPSQEPEGFLHEEVDSEPGPIISKLPGMRRCSTPFVKRNDSKTLFQREKTGNKLLSSRASIKQDVGIASPVLKRAPLHASNSCPNMSFFKSDSVKVPSPPQSPPSKNRPSTPFLLNRARIACNKPSKKHFQAWAEKVEEESPDKEDSESADESGEETESSDSVDFDRKTDRDKIRYEEFGSTKNLQPSYKIRMDKTSFQQWIQEHRLP
eukprot:gene13038-3813_t